MTTRLIVNADDFGQAPGVTRGIIEAHERGIVTSTSLMVRWPDAPAAAAYAKRRPQLGVGLHVDLGEWRYRDGEGWVPVYQVVPQDDFVTVHAEAWRQLERFRTLMGVEPTHLDSHQHVHRSGTAHEVLQQMAAALGVPLRHDTASVRYCGDFYGQDGMGQPLHARITAEALAALLEQLPEGTTELACHPGLDASLDSMYAEERVLEVRALCDPRVRDRVASCGVVLATFRDVPAERRQA